MSAPLVVCALVPTARPFRDRCAQALADLLQQPIGIWESETHSFRLVPASEDTPSSGYTQIARIEPVKTGGAQ